LNLDFHVTFTPYLLRKDMDWGWPPPEFRSADAARIGGPRDLIQSMMAPA